MTFNYAIMWNPTEDERKEKKIGNTSLGTGEVVSQSFATAAIEVKGKIPTGYNVEQIELRLRAQNRNRTLQTFYPKYL